MATAAETHATLLAALNEIDAAAVLGVHPRTLANWRWAGKGPRYIRVGHRRVYRPEDLRKFLDANAVEPSS